MKTDWLVARSVQVMKEGQQRNGAFVASPRFGTYQYAWLRDGGFVAYALDVAGEHLAAANWYRWVHHAVGHHLYKVEDLIVKRREGRSVGPDDFLHARYTLDGREGTEPWGNHQLDGYGIYLWGVAEHVRLAGDRVFLEEIRRSVEGIVRYLMEFWHEPCFDCWEENGHQIHTSTLAAVYGGLNAVNRYLKREEIAQTCQAIKAFVEQNAVVNGRFCKSDGDPAVDANLLWLTMPFGMFQADDVRIIRTVEAMEAELVTGGVHRYSTDSFYGGGAWILLTAWLGLYYAEAGNDARAHELLAWIEQQADDNGDLPEQVPEGLFVPQAHSEWVSLWGENAKPLLWSHAMYLILKSHYR